MDRSKSTGAAFYMLRKLKDAFRPEGHHEQRHGLQALAIFRRALGRQW